MIHNPFILSKKELLKGMITTKTILILISLIFLSFMKIECTQNNDDDYPPNPLQNVKIVPGKHTVGSASVEFVGTSPDGYFNVIFDYNSGASRYEMGRNYGQALQQAVTGIEEYYAWLIERYTKYNTYIDRVKILKGYMELDYKDEIEGFASQFSGGSEDKKDGKLSVNEIYFFNTPAGDRISECSTIAVFGARSASGGTISARLHDWGPGYPTIAVFTIKNGSKSYLSISFLLGIRAGATQISDDGIFIGGTEAPTGLSYPDITAKPYGAGRNALEEYSTVEDVANYILTTNIMWDTTLLISGPNDAKILEYAVNGMRALRSDKSELNPGLSWGFDNAVVAVNAFMLKGNIDNFLYNPIYGNTTFNFVRWESYKTQLAAKGPTVTFEEMKEIVAYCQDANNYIYNSSTQYIVVFDSATFRLEIYPRNYREFTLNPKFIQVPVKFD